MTANPLIKPTNRKAKDNPNKQTLDQQQNRPTEAANQAAIIMMMPAQFGRKPTCGYAQTISRATNLHQAQPLCATNSFSPIAQANLTSLQSYYDPMLGTLTMGPNERNFLAQRPNFKESLMSHWDQQALLNRPLCRCRVMYLGSSVPHITKNGLHGIQEPLRQLYPEEQFNSNYSSTNPSSNLAAGTNEVPNSPSTTIDISHLSSSLGIDSWLSVWSNGLLLQNVDEFGREIKRFFSIESLHYCAAIRFFDTSTLVQDQHQATLQPAEMVGDLNNNTVGPVSGRVARGGGGKPVASESAQDGASQQRQKRSAVRFLPLDAPIFQCPGMIDAKHPPVFAAIMRRTTGIKVLECHAFICRRDAAANALVRCCTHAYADFLSAKKLSVELTNQNGTISNGFNRRQANSKRTHLQNKRGSDCIVVEATLNHQTNSLTATSNEDNSLEASSEDNYAVITKHNHQPKQNQAHGSAAESHPDQPAAFSGQRVLGQEPGAEGASRGEEEEEEEAREARRGSSKSLYDDFMPKTSQPVGEARRDLDTRSKEMEKMSHSLDLIEILTCYDDNNHYSSNRHSKSMQNLDRTFEFSANEARTPPRSRRNRQKREHKDRSIERSRRAASFQDMAAGRKKCTAPELTANSMGGSRAQPNRPHDVTAQQQAGSLELETRFSGQSTRESGAEPLVRPANNLSSRSKKSSSKRREHRRRDRLPTNHIESAQMLPTPMHPLPEPAYYGKAPLICTNQPNQLAPMCLPYYMPHSTAAAHYQQPQLYSQAQIYDPYYQAPPIHFGRQHPMAPNFISPHQAMPAIASMYANTTQSRKSKSSGSTLARFRCLSPPVNILSGAKHSPGSSNQTEPASTDPRAGTLDGCHGEQGGQTQNGRDKKMSWIKRLSLTMTSNGFSDTESESAIKTLSIDPSGSSNMTQPKKRSSLLLGSLTLGRGKQRHQKLVAS